MIISGWLSACCLSQRCYNAGILVAYSVWIGLLAISLVLVQLLCVLALTLDARRYRMGLIERLAWVSVFLLFGIVGSMLYLAATDSKVPRAVIPVQVLVVAAAIGILSAR